MISWILFKLILRFKITLIFLYQITFMGVSWLVRQLLRGKTAKEIGRILGLSHRTIEHRIERMKLKLEADNKSHLIEILLSHKPFLLIGESNRLRKD